MRANDDLLSVQGSVYTLVDAEGYLVREDIQNGRYRYPISGGQGQDYTAGSGLLLNDAEFSVDFTKVAGKNEIISYSAGSGLILDNGEFSVNFTEVCKSIDNLSASDKDKLNKLVLELDWDNATDLELETAYTASRGGIICVRVLRGDLQAIYATCLSWGPNQDGSETGDNYYNGATNYSTTGNLVTSWFVMKGDKYLVSATSAATIVFCKFIPFKNSISA